MIPSPEAQRATLDSILTALELAALPQQREQLLALVALLHRWNATYNLTSIRDPAAMMIQHIADCLAVIKPLRARSAPLRLLDVGSGAGFPGSIIAIMLPETKVTCIDSVGKKAAFVRQVSAALSLTNLDSVHERVEDHRPSQHFDVITSRAFSDLGLFTKLSRPLLAQDGLWMAMKGVVPQDEIVELERIGYTVDVEQLQVPMLEAHRSLIWLKVCAR